MNHVDRRDLVYGKDRWKNANRYYSEILQNRFMPPTLSQQTPKNYLAQQEGSRISDYNNSHFDSNLIITTRASSIDNNDKILTQQFVPISIPILTLIDVTKPTCSTKWPENGFYPKAKGTNNFPDFLKIYPPPLTMDKDDSSSLNDNKKSDLESIFSIRNQPRKKSKSISRENSFTEYLKPNQVVLKSSEKSARSRDSNISSDDAICEKAEKNLKEIVRRRVNDNKSSALEIYSVCSERVVYQEPRRAFKSLPAIVNTISSSDHLNDKKKRYCKQQYFRDSDEIYPLSGEMMMNSNNSFWVTEIKWRLFTMTFCAFVSLLLAFLGLVLLFHFKDSYLHFQTSHKTLHDQILRKSEQKKDLNVIESGTIKRVDNYNLTLTQLGLLMSLLAINLNFASFLISFTVSYFFVKIVALPDLNHKFSAYVKYKYSTSTSLVFALMALLISILFYLITIVIYLLTYFDLQTIMISCIFIGVIVIVIMFSLLHTANTWYNIVSQNMVVPPSIDKDGIISTLAEKITKNSFDINKYLYTLV
ncbi:unnamed protein product [Gordionus sp. m RMFG-2023]